MKILPNTIQSVHLYYWELYTCLHITNSKTHKSIDLHSYAGRSQGM